MTDSDNGMPDRQEFAHLSDAHWATLEKMVSVLGEQAFAGFPELPHGEQRVRIEKFDRYERSLIAHVTAAAQDIARATVSQSAAHAAVRESERPANLGSTKAVKMKVPKFDGKEADSLVFWIREIEIALSAGQIYDHRSQVAFALSNLGGRARAWAMARETANPGHFATWSAMEQELRTNFLLANVAYRHRSSFLRCKQGKRTLQDYVMELQNLEAAMAGAPLSEDVKVTVFMDGVRPGPVRTELFRRQPTKFDEAVHLALLEDHCVRSAHGHTAPTDSSDGPTPMEISSVEATQASRRPRASGRCFGCNQMGHFRRNCPSNPWRDHRAKPSAKPSLNSAEVDKPGNGDSQ